MGSHVSGPGEEGLLCPRNDKNSNGCRWDILAQVIPFTILHRHTLSSTFDRPKPSGNINLSFTPPLSSQYGPSSSETKRPKS
jgi:hypothetical protein